MNKREFEAGIKTELTHGSTYGDYLQLSQLLTSQVPRSEEPDELLFIIQHQTSELWLKLMLHELDRAVAHVRADELEPCFKVLARVGHIQRMLFEQWSVLETLTPYEYLAFRDQLGPASGFQSAQYRAVEFVLGNKDAQALLPFRHEQATHAGLRARLEAPSLYDEFLRHLARQGFDVPVERVDRDFSQPYEAHPAVQALFQQIYEAPESHWNAYEMAEKLIDVEERFQLWRYRHMMTVMRIIGFKRGTGGSSGVGFLRKALDLRFFPELWEVRTDLRPRDRSGAGRP